MVLISKVWQSIIIYMEWACAKNIKQDIKVTWDYVQIKSIFTHKIYWEYLITAQFCPICNTVYLHVFFLVR